MRADQILAAEETDAWFEYLTDTRGQPDDRYRELEPWAWNRLQTRLKTIDTRRDKLRRDAEEVDGA
jgi:hypothetical protein